MNPRLVHSISARVTPICCWLTWLVMGAPLTLAVELETDFAFQPPALSVPPGFEIELVAAPPLVNYPMLADLDDRGRLFIAESDGQNLDKEGLLRERSRFIRLLEDTDGDGRFDKSSIFADGMVMPEGALWFDGSLYVLSAPYLWRLQDLDHDGVADRREKLVGTFDFRGNPNQHGPYLGPNGRLYFSGGVFGYDLVGKDGQRAGQGKAAGVFSCLPDGTDVQIFSLGGVNPVDVAFSPAGEMFSTCAIFDEIGGRHDALVHWVRGAMTQRVWLTPLLKETGYRLPALHRWGQVAPSGLVRYRGVQFGAAYRGNYFACHFNTHKVVRIRLQRQGATFHSHAEDFMVSPSIDFHPTDVLEDADGSLLVLDTGAWVFMGCPTSKIAKPNIRGAIYRIRKTNAAEFKDPRGAGFSWTQATAQELVARLEDPRPAVRDRAVEALVDRSANALPALRQAVSSSNEIRTRRLVVWTLARIDRLESRAILRLSLADEDASVRQAAVRSCGLLKDSESMAALTKLVVDDSPPIRRAAATSLGQLGRGEAVPALLASLDLPDNDTHLMHALIYALIEIDDRAATRTGLTHHNPRVQRAALTALDQMQHGQLVPEWVLPLVEAPDAELKQAALKVIASRKEWGGKVQDLLQTWLTNPILDTANDAIWPDVLLTYSGNPQVQTLMASALASPKTPPSKRLRLLATLGQLESLPKQLDEPIRACLGSADQRLRYQAIITLATSGNTVFDEQLLSLANDTNEATEMRVAAWDVLARHGKGLDDPTFEWLIREVGRTDAQPLERRASAAVLGNAPLLQQQLTSLCSLVETAGPLELPELIKAFDRGESSEKQPNSTDENESDGGSLALGLRLVDALKRSHGSAALPVNRIKQIFQTYPIAVQTAARPLLAGPQHDLENQQARMAELESSLVDGDVPRGEAIFFGNRAICATCHRVAGRGGNLGPDLSEIGKIRSRRDLLEAIVYPSATIANGYESQVIVDPVDEINIGIIQQVTAEALYLRTVGQSTLRIPREDIKEMTTSPVSIMPPSLDKVISPAELADLMAFLESRK